MSLPLHASDFLLRHGWLAHQPKDVQLALSEIGEVVELPAGHVISNGSENSRYLTALVSGATNVSLSSEFFEPSLMHVELPGSWSVDALFGRTHKSTVTVKTRTPCQVALFSKKNVTLLETEVPALQASLVALSTGHYELALNIIAVHSERDAQTRVQLTLLRLIGDGLIHGLRSSRGPIDLPVNQTDLAELCLMSRNSVGPVLSKLERQNAIEIGYRNIRIVDRELLRPKILALHHQPSQFAV